MVSYNRLGLDLVVFATICLLLTYDAVAVRVLQDPQDNANPAQIERRLNKTDNRPKVGAAPTEAKQSENLSKVANFAPFTLSAVKLEGITVFDAETMATIYESYLARTVGPNEAAEIVELIADQYRDAGYIFSYAIIPPQQINAGVLTIRIVEGFIETAKFEEANCPADSLSRFTRLVTNERPLRRKTLERAITIIHDLPGVSIADSKIKVDNVSVGSHHLVMVLKCDPVDVSLYVDNRGTDAVGRVQTSATVSLNSIFTGGDQNQFTYFTTPSDFNELQFFSNRYSLPLNGNGTRLSFGGSISFVEAGGAFEGLNVESESFSLFAEISHQVIRTRQTRLNARLIADVRNVDQDFDSTQTLGDRIRAFRGSVDYFHSFGSSSLLVTTTASQGLSILDSDIDPTLLSRVDAVTDFSKIELFASASHRLNDTFSVRLDVAGQLSANPLFASEEFALGGSRIGRAFDFNELTGDDGYGGYLELSASLPVLLPAIEAWRLYGFGDYGEVFNRGDFPSQSLSSLGAGLSLTILDGVVLNGEIAFPISGTPFETDDRDPRFFFSVFRRF